MKKYLTLVAVVATVSACQTIDSWISKDKTDGSEQSGEVDTKGQSIIGYIIDQSPTSPNAKPEAESLRKKALRTVYLSNNIANDAPRALNEINRAIDIDQTNFSLYSARAVIYRDFLKEYPRALDDYNKAIAFNPDEISLYFNRAIVHKSLNNVISAIGDYNTAITKADNTYKGVFFKANAYQSLGMLRKDIKDYGLAEANLELAKDMYSSLYNQSLTNNDMQMFQNSYMERLEQVKRALQAIKELQSLDKMQSSNDIGMDKAQTLELIQ